ncbi:hypothetical protein MXAN_4363 [Myxococcus xanthus DK 1622]|uniref:Uncharacterized protein n=1 Tax=Myxococcus xanthus (strain DK1622) TaxID=246197 RepID=Q1D487_MYXXD|nr:hypothetical protein MXAN_4363 [Myxococcus xanthus DK 1622]
MKPALRNYLGSSEGATATAVTGWAGAGAGAAGRGGGLSTSLTDGIFRMSPRATFHACWTIQDSERSCLVASRWISSSMSSGK